MYLLEWRVVSMNHESHYTNYRLVIPAFYLKIITISYSEELQCTLLLCWWSSYWHNSDVILRTCSSVDVWLSNDILQARFCHFNVANMLRSTVYAFHRYHWYISVLAVYAWLYILCLLYISVVCSYILLWYRHKLQRDFKPIFTCTTCLHF